MAARTPAGAMHLGLAAVLLLLGFLVSAGVARERVREREEPVRRAALARLVGDRRAAIRDLSKEIDALSRDLTSRRKVAASGSEELRTLFAEVEALESAVGAGPLSGPGVVVVLSDSARVPTDPTDVSELHVQDVDLQLTVNALWRAGAEAIAVNGRRVASTTAIRSAGGRVLVNFEPIASPYTVQAIGATEGLRRRFESTDIAGRFEVWAQVYGLGFAVRDEDAIRMPGMPAATLRSARPAR